MSKLLRVAAFCLGLLGLAGGAHATCPVPNPNLLGPPFFDNCPMPASVMNNFLIGSNITTALGQTLSETGSPGGPIFPNVFTINDNNLVIPGLAFMTGWSFTDNFGGSSATGGRQTLEANVIQTSVTSSSNTFRDYVAGTFLAKTAVGDGGTNLTTDPRGNYFSLNPYYLLDSGATNVGLATGGEVNSIVISGASLKFKSLWNLVGGGGDAVKGSTWDTMLVFSNQASSVKHDSLILIGDMHGDWPISASGSVLTVDSFTTATAANGIDFNPATGRGVSFSGCSFRSKGFSACINSVDGAMNAAGTWPISAATQWSLTTNMSNSAKEVSLINDDTTATITYAIYQKTGASAGTAVIQGNATNTSMPALVLTAPPSAAHAGGNACLGIKADGTVYVSTTITTC